jgi:hypothetical protein
MKNGSDRLEMPCPVCGRTCDLSASTDAATCGRCEADLDACRAMIGKAQALLEKAARALPMDPEQALRLAERSQLLHATDEARRLIMLGQLCSRQYSAALAGWLHRPFTASNKFRIHNAYSDPIPGASAMPDNIAAPRQFNVENGETLIPL